MATIQAFGSYLPDRVVLNEEIAGKLNRTPEWILNVSGIEERRYAAPDESVADMAVAAAKDCLDRAGIAPSDVGMFIVASGSSERRFPGPAATVAHRLGTAGTPALDLPMASAGALFAMATARSLADVQGKILVIGAEKMSSVVLREPMEQGIAILFGDGAGACLIGPGEGRNRIVDIALHSDGAFAEDLRLEFDCGLAMNGRSVIMQASRKIPAAISEVLERNGKPASSVKIFLLHQANQNLIDGVARTLNVDSGKFYSNIRRYGNTSSASMLIAAAEWWSDPGPEPGDQICFAVFGAGFHWGALLVEG